AIVLFFELVFDGVGRGIAALPEGFDELIALFVVGELFKGGAFFVGDDPTHVLVEPFLVGFTELDLQTFSISLFLIFAQRALEGICLLLVLPCGSLVFGFVLVILPESGSDQAQNCNYTWDQKMPTETYLGHDGGTPY